MDYIEYLTCVLGYTEEEARRIAEEEGKIE